MIRNKKEQALTKFTAVRIFIAVLVAFFMIHSHSMSQIRTENQQNSEKLDEIKKQIEQASQRAIEFENAARSVSLEISQIQQQLIKSASDIQTTEDQIFAKQAKLRELRETRANLEESLKNKKFEMASTLGAMQRLSAQKTNVVAFRPGSAINTLRTTSLLKVILPDLKSRADSLEEDLSELVIVRLNIEQENTELRQALTRLVISNNDIDDLLAQRVTKQKELEYSTRAEREKLKQFAENASSLQQLIEQIDNEIKSREEAARLAQDNLKDRPDLPSANIASLSPPSGSLSFASAKGNLPLPARGSINQIFGQLMSTGQRSTGISIATRSGATVISPHDGRIVFAGNFRTYGQLLIIAHGEGYHTLLAGMKNIYGIVGQWILKGEPVGQMNAGGDTSNSRQKLYVEFRQNGKPINPVPWIMASDRRAGS